MIAQYLAADGPLAKEIAPWATIDGGLYDLSKYIFWSPKNVDAVLDGWFTAAELRAIAEYMDAHQQ